MTDNELEKDSPTKFDEFVKFCGNADVLVHDAQYTEETYDAHVGWGHSSTHNVVRLAREAGVKKLILYHHDPESTDPVVDKILADAQEIADGSVAVDAAREGLVVES